LIYPHALIIMSLALVLRIRRTLTGEEIDKLISDVQARKAQAAEHRAP
jgi:hypothetical protein